MTIYPHSTLQSAFADRRVLKVISGLNNFDRDRVAATIKAAELGGATFVDIAADAAGVGVGSAINQLNSEVAMIAAVRGLVEALASANSRAII
ncbi:DUF561 domain-containing protein [Anabaenopsis elenkinii CCIBt3563]|uniref:DUF561 domain-containing protein n=1 Tax=Anabaenopsis elenkinii CCIBt3563 TaxID=2779889 RepID=A0A7S6RE33_9CYAN|nr:DUF561 domain-containing protein [Anabaenopsis elenkinii CCIBt3563]